MDPSTVLNRSLELGRVLVGSDVGLDPQCRASESETKALTSLEAIVYRALLTVP